MPVKKGAKKTVNKAKKGTARKSSPGTAGPKAASRKPAATRTKKTATAGLKKPLSMATTSDRRKERLRKILLKKRNEIVKELEEQLGKKLIFDPGQRIDSAMDSADQSALDVDTGIDYSLLEMKYEQYKDIAEAFRKLQNNTYGLCEECGTEIDIKRLAVNPLARYCIECKTRKEELENIQKEEARFKE